MSAAKIADPVIHALIDRVQIGAPPTADAARYRQGATVSIATHDGRRFSNTVYAPKGAAALGIEWRDVDAKYRALVPMAGLDERAIEASLTLIHDFRRLRDVAGLARSLRTGAGA